MSRYGLCLARLAAGDRDGAERECAAAVEIWQDVLGAAHPDTALGVKSAGIVAFAAGRVEEGCRRIDEALAIERSALGGDHPHVAVSKAALAECASARHEDAKAVTLLTEAHAIFEARYGPSHSKTIETLARLGRAFLDAGDASRAQALLEHAQAAERDAKEAVDPLLRAATAHALARATGDVHAHVEPPCKPGALFDWRCDELARGLGLTSSRTTASP